MNDGGIFILKSLILGAALILQTEIIDVRTQELAGAFDQPSQGIVQNHLEPAPALQALQGFQKLAGQILETERPTHTEEVAKSPSPESWGDVPPPQGEEDPAKKALDQVLEGAEKLAEKVAEPEDKPRQSPEANLELQKARTSELEMLEKAQEDERKAWTAQKAGQITLLNETYGDSPEGKKYLKEFSGLAQEIEKEMGDRHDTQLRQHEERWEQKFQQYAEQPLIVPTDPGRDDRYP